MQKYTGANLKTELLISRLYTIHYFEYSNDFKFSGERHDFWEFVYVDRGEVTAVADDKSYVLKQGDIIFHKPGEWHNIAGGADAANVVVVSFDSKSPAMDFFRNKILKAGQNQKNIISKIISEYSSAFSTPLNNLYSYKLQKKSDAVIGSQQLLKQYICELLFSLMRSSPSENQHPLISLNRSEAMLNLIIGYMQNNMAESITVNDLVRYSGSNRTTIYDVFKENFGVGPVKYFIRLKMETAKKYLREKNYNITQISELLGYSSIHYFSRQFKSETGMSPIEYSNSIKAMTEI